MNIKKVGIVGCGIMGAGIAQVTAQAKYDVIVSETNETYLKKGLASVESGLAKAVEKGKLSTPEMSAALRRIIGTTKMSDFADCDIVIEAVPDILEIKQKVFVELYKICSPRAVLATNTSTLSVIEIASATGCQDRVIGTHFFNPVPVMKLVEVIKSISTSDAALETGKQFVISLGKTVVVAPDVPGFLVNRLMAPLGTAVIEALESGLATKEDIDTALRLGANLPMGRLELFDLVGLDTILAGYENMYREYKDKRYAPPLLLKRMVSAGWLGRKSGKGFYNYEKK